MVKIELDRVYWGPSIYAADPIVVVRVSVEDNFMDTLKEYMVTMTDTFADWLPKEIQRGGDDVGRSVAHFLVEWSLGIINGSYGYIQSAGARSINGKIHAWLGFNDPKISLDHIFLARNLLLEIGGGRMSAQEAVSVVDKFVENSRARHPDFQARILMRAAFLRNIPYQNFAPAWRHWRFGWGANSELFFESSSEKDSFLGQKIVRNKDANKVYMSALGAPVAKHILVSEVDELEKVENSIGFPCVLKPIDSSQAKGVTVDIRVSGELKEAFFSARKLSNSPVMVERHLPGDVHRLLVVKGRFVAATRRLPATVVGDGSSNIVELAESFNRRRVSGARPGHHLGPVPFDAEFDRVLAGQGLSRDSIPEINTRVRLRQIPLLGTGADNVDVTDLVHEDTKFVSESLAKTLSLSVVGFDFVSTDIAKSCHEKGAFLEMNLCPSLRGHMQDGEDIRNVADHVLGNSLGRVPSVLVVTDTLSVESAKQLLARYPGLGWRFTDGVGVGGCLFDKVALGNPIAASFALLSNKCVERILFICTDTELMSFGMPLDRVDHAVEQTDLDFHWSEVLIRHSGAYTKVSDAIDLEHLLAMCFPVM